jgi:hypothetical protein
LRATAKAIAERPVTGILAPLWLRLINERFAAGKTLQNRRYVDTFLSSNYKSCLFLIFMTAVAKSS